MPRIPSWYGKCHVPTSGASDRMSSVTSPGTGNPRSHASWRGLGVSYPPSPSSVLDCLENVNLRFWMEKPIVESPTSETSMAAKYRNGKVGEIGSKILEFKLILV